MIADSARPLARTLRFYAAAAALLVSLTTAAGALAQDTKHVVCPANKTGDGSDCSEGVPGRGAPGTGAPVDYLLDWVPIDQVPAELRDLDCLLCRGR